MNIGIYKITNLINSKSYIGQSVNIPVRWKRHKNNAINSESEQYHYPLYQAIRKYGIENFSFEIVEECDCNELNSKEFFWIKYYNSSTNGYNQNLEEYNIIPQKMTIEVLNCITEDLKNSDLQIKDIATKYGFHSNMITAINTGKSWVRDIEYPIRKLQKTTINTCIDCNREISQTATRCVECAHKVQRVSNRPSREELKILIRTTPFTKIGQQFNVSDNAIRKWCEDVRLPKKAKEIKSYSDQEWELI